jgi:hypothetical protein
MNQLLKSTLTAPHTVINTITEMFKQQNILLTNEDSFTPIR